VSIIIGWLVRIGKQYEMRRLEKMVVLGREEW